MKMLTIVIGIFAFSHGSFAQTTWYVDIANCPGPGTGNEVDPFCSIQTAIDSSVDGDTIAVEAGIYFENIDLLGKQITLNGLAGAASTFIDGQDLGTIIRCTSGETRQTVISGFTIREGSGEDIGLPNGGPAGGGFLIDASSPTIRSCVFTMNTARHGGAIGNFNAAKPLIVNCEFFGNTVSGSPNGYGGAIANWPDCDAEIQGCVFTSNSASGNFNGFGGAIYSRDSSPLISHCEFRNNSAFGGSQFGFGGAISNEFQTSSPLIANCLFVDNFAEHFGGAIQNGGASNETKILSCTIFDNIAGARGGGVDIFSGSQSILNTIVWGNSAPSSSDFFTNAGATPTISYSDIESSGGSGLGWDLSLGVDGGGNIDADPLLSSEHLTTASPCIDAANSDPVVAAGVLTDLDGNIRYSNHPKADSGIGQFTFMDMGAYELDGVVACTACPGDLNFDGVVNVSDLLMLLAAWGACPF